MRLAVALITMLTVSHALADEAPNMEFVVTEKLLTEFLVAASPIERALSSSATGLDAADLRVTFSNPKVHITNAAIKVTMDFRLHDGSGMIDVSGVASPDLRLVPVPAKKIIEARFSHLTVSLPGGIALPLEGQIEAINLPGVWNTEVSFGERTLLCEATATDVVPEMGQVRLRGHARFTPKNESKRKP